MIFDNQLNQKQIIMNKGFLYVVAAILLFSFTGCEKDDDEKSKTELICDKDWKLSAWTFEATYQGVTQNLDVFNNPELVAAPSCILDDFIDFKENGTFVTKPAGEDCDYVLFADGEWKFSTEETILSMKSTGDAAFLDYTLEILNETTCKISIIEPIEVESSLKAFQLGPDDEVDSKMTMTFEH